MKKLLASLVVAIALVSVTATPASAAPEIQPVRWVYECKYMGEWWDPGGWFTQKKTRCYTVWR